MWLLFALISPLFWAIVHVADSHCVKWVFHRPWMGVITSSMASLIVVMAIPFAIPFVTWQMPSMNIILLALFAGALIQLSQGFYFQSLEYSEAGIVAAYWNMTPMFLPVASFMFFGKVLAGWHYFGIAILIFGSIKLCLLDTSLKTRWRSFLLMLTASLLQVIALLIEKHVFEAGTFFIGFLLITGGIIFSGLLPLISRKIRMEFSNNIIELRQAIPLILLIEGSNLAALFMSQRAIDLGIPSLVAAVETTIPAYTFGLSIILGLATQQQYGDPSSRNRLPTKLLLVILMVIGVWILSNGD